MKLVILNGASCSGKSAVIKDILEKKDHFFHLSYDSVKWSFSKYSHFKHREDVRNLIFSMAKSIFKMKYDVISDSFIYREQVNKLIDLALTEEYEILEINLEADVDVLLNRFEKRLTEMSKNPEIKISNQSKGRFMELYNLFNKEKNPSALTFRTDACGIEDISASILKLL